MRYIADLHIHSKYSRATAKNLDLEHLYIAAQVKGITVLATGDFTHPAWFAEICEKLVPAEEGLFALEAGLAAACDREVPASCQREVRFILCTEISSIYKKNGVTRKNHNLVFLPDLEAVARFNTRLEAIGNIHADGRPILGLDARNLLEIALEVSSEAFLIPAHIWTPWFSLFGSKSGFDAISECFEDLTPHIFALETGLSSDPLMNWRVSDIDGLTLVSNSDAHSPANLGREANLFYTERSYAGLKQALRSGDPRKFLGTFEFYPEEGKYHYDGHRNCGVCLHPRQSLACDGLCPVCGQPLTLGVLHRVEKLADREPGEKPEKHHPYYSLVPLAAILSEILGVGPKSKKVTGACHRVLETFGPEFEVLYTAEPAALKEKGPPLLDTAIERMRSGEIELQPGFDGEYGRVKIFKDGEKEQLRGEQTLFAVPAETPPADSGSAASPAVKEASTVSGPRQMDLFSLPEEEAPAGDGESSGTFLSVLNPQQRAAVDHGQGPLMIVAGPGSGKTRTITCRMARLIKEERVEPARILAITFTRRAAGEMQERLEAMLGTTELLPRVSTFHAFCLAVLKETGQPAPVILDDNDRRLVLADALEQIEAAGIEITTRPETVLHAIARAKQSLRSPGDELGDIAGDIPVESLAAVYSAYQEMLAFDQACDYEDLLLKVVRLLEEDADLGERYREWFAAVFIDEYQDLNYAQYRLVRLLVPPEGEVCVIGDPDQAIYGFRGSDPVYFNRFVEDYPTAQKIVLDTNYRSTATILAASYDVICRQESGQERVRAYAAVDGGTATLTVAQLASEKAEAVFIGRTIEELVGGLGFHSVDFGQAGYEAAGAALAFSDFSVLVRTRAQLPALTEMLEGAGIPCQAVSKENLWARNGIAELLAFLRLCEGKGSLVDFSRIAALHRARVKETTLAALKQWCRQRELSAADMLSAVQRFPIETVGKSAQRELAELAGEILTLQKMIQEKTLVEKIRCITDTRPELHARIEGDPRTGEALAQLLTLARACGTGTGRLLETVALSTDAEALLPEADRVRLMTMHAAKGLEFPVVFVAGCEDGLLPYGGDARSAAETAEERRLFYVAMTRARQRLFLTWAAQRQIYGKREKREISPFVADIEASLLERVAPASGGRKAGAKAGPVQLDLF